MNEEKKIQPVKYVTNIQKIKTFENTDHLKLVIGGQYMKQIENYFGDKDKAMKFLSSMMASVQRNPKLLECTPTSLINGFIMMAELQLMPSGVSGEAYMIPYMNKGVSEAQFQLGYQGLVTLFYRAGLTAIYSDIVRENDGIELSNGGVKHTIDPKKSNKERGKEIGAYVIVTFKGSTMGKYMHADDIMAIGKKFSKSYYEFDFSTKKYTDKISKYTPWNEDNDPEKWMWKKTVVKQMAKLLPKNETINKAIDFDNRDSIIYERLNKATEESQSLTMGNLLKHENNNKKEGEDNESQDGITDAESTQDNNKYQEPTIT